MVSEKIIPKIWTVAGLMLDSPHTALYWGSYLMKVCQDTKSLCMQFESVVTNSSLSFSDVMFLEFKEDIASILNLSSLGDIDWQQVLDDLSAVSGSFSVADLSADINTLYATGASLASAGLSGVGDALLQKSAFSELFNGNANKIFDLYDSYHDLYDGVEKSAGNTLLATLGGKDNIAGLFNISDYDVSS